MQFLGFENNVHILRRREPDGRLRDSFTDMSMKAFAAVLAMWASRTPYENVAVVDMTGMQGRFDFVVVSDAASTRDNPLAALQRILPGELGLALESRKEMVDVVVVDHMDTPSAR